MLHFVVMPSHLSKLLFKDYRRRVLELLLLNPDRQFHVREIARLTDTLAGTMHKELTSLADSGLLIKETMGNKVQYRANTDCPVFSELESIIRKTSKPKRSRTNKLLEQHRDAILSLAQKNGIRNVRVFGSMARGEATQDSDVDFLVELEEGQSGFALGGFLEDVSALLHRDVDVVTEKALHPKIQKKVLGEAIAL